MEVINILGIVVLIIGIILIGIEFYMPGFGFPGIFGIIFTAAGIYLTGRDTAERVTVGVIAIVIIAVMLVISIILFNSKKVKSPIKLDTDLSGKDLFIEGKDMEYLIGKKGVAITDLKPLGKGEFDGVVLDITAREYISKGASLEIREIKNNKIIVREG
ncbi:MAG: serine protease [Lachnospiraceae bacterium]|nr:serine protease [Lachnospiraceae bacterium]MCR5768999.1 serine protease [Lachnospiraceae bacterium]